MSHPIDDLDRAEALNRPSFDEIPLGQSSGPFETAGSPNSLEVQQLRVLLPPIPVLDHGYVRFVESWGSGDAGVAEAGIIEAARQSTQGSFRGWDVDQKLLGYLFNSKPQHATPFEFAGLVIEVQAPIFVFREWHRHRTQCLAGDTMLHFQRPCDGKAYKMPISEVWKRWQETVRTSRPERQTNSLWNRNRMSSMALRCVNEETKEVVLTRVTDAIKSEAKQLFRLTTVGGHSIRTSADHRFFTDRGWLRLEDAVRLGAAIAVETTAKQLTEAWEYDRDFSQEKWKDVVGWEGVYEVSNAGRVRRCGKAPKQLTIGAQGYPVVSLNRPGMQQTRTVHTLVLEAWHGPKPEACEARHINSNRIDARSDNLIWGTPKENAQDKVTRGSQQSLGVLFEEIRSCTKDGVEETYDISVEGPWHNFIADGCVVHNSYNEMSARYAPLPDLNYIPHIDRLMLGASTTNKQAGTVKDAEVLTLQQAEDFQLELMHMYQQQENFYQKWLKAGVPKELARIDLPVGRYSRMRGATNLRNWLAFLLLRNDPGAQWEIQQYARAVETIISQQFPRVHKLFVERRELEAHKELLCRTLTDGKR